MLIPAHSQEGDNTRRGNARYLGEKGSGFRDKWYVDVLPVLPTESVSDRRAAAKEYFCQQPQG